MLHRLLKASILAAAIACTTVAAATDASIPQPYDKRVELERIAFLFANESYKYLTPVASADNDADKIAATLADLKFEVKKISNADATSLTTELKRLIKERLGKLANGRRAAVFVYFAGHGGTDSQDLYLIPKEYCPYPKDDDGTYDHSVPVGTVLDMFNDRRIGAAWLIIDACRTEIKTLPFTESPGTVECPRVGTPKLPDKITIGLNAPFQSLEVAGVLYSTTLLTPSGSPTSGDVSAFANALSNQLRISDEAVNQIWFKVKTDVAAATAKTNLPMIPISVNGVDYHFISNEYARAYEDRSWANVLNATAEKEQLVCSFAKYNPASDYYADAVDWLLSNNKPCPGVIDPRSPEVRIASSIQIDRISPIAQLATVKSGSIGKYAKVALAVPPSLKEVANPVVRAELKGRVITLVRENGERLTQQVTEKAEEVASSLQPLFVKGANWSAIQDDCESDKCKSRVEVANKTLVEAAKTMYSRQGRINLVAIPAIPRAGQSQLTQVARAFDTAVEAKLAIVSTVPEISRDLIDIQVLPNTESALGNLPSAPVTGGLFLNYYGLNTSDYTAR